ncbi:putative N-acetyltransferase YhbS [Erwinia toletana]|uniref:N-acetyltransferase YhbS n=1 Tax=Winslowiella toletana TaxID=92490 RepID=A0ABS4P6C2_9GAMM|nr:GNAT family N-acetyltransferase [Winslowiella toletana]MBP2168135.1 putative N-acetyltransferase YhbS [Winslowiella toletana]
MALRIVSLTEAPEHRELITDWLWQAFGSDNSRDFYASVINSCLSGQHLPLTFVALEGSQPVGTVGVWRCDLISRQDLFPWLAALYVAPEYRGRGVSEQLQQHVIAWCQAHNYPEIWLYSACADYYERFGWRYIGDALDYPDIPVRLYHQAISGTA